MPCGQEFSSCFKTRGIGMRYLLCILLLSVSFAFGAQYGDALLAIVGEKVITARELHLNVRNEEARLSLEYSGKELEGRVEALRRNALESLIERELCYLEFKDLKAKVPTDYLQMRLNEIIQSRSNGNVVAFEDFLHRQGSTMKEFKDELEKDIAVAMLKNEKTSRGNIVSEKEISEYYEKEKANMAVDSSYRLSVIQLRKDGRYAGRIQETCDAIFARLREGVPFENLAREYSEGANAEDGGDQGWMSRLNEKLMEAIEKLAPGQASMKPVEIGSNVYVVKLSDMRKGGVPELNGELREKIRSLLAKNESERRYRNFIRQLYMKFPVHRMDGVVD